MIFCFDAIGVDVCVNFLFDLIVLNFNLRAFTHDSEKPRLRVRRKNKLI